MPAPEDAGAGRCRLARARPPCTTRSDDQDEKAGSVCGSSCSYTLLWTLQNAAGLVHAVFALSFRCLTSHMQHGLGDRSPLPLGRSRPGRAGRASDGRFCGMVRCDTFTRDETAAAAPHTSRRQRGLYLQQYLTERNGSGKDKGTGQR
jgi:hypothetical protein